jgi:hypothetical protein
MARLNASVLSAALTDWSSRNFAAVLRRDSFGVVSVCADCSLSRALSSEAAAAARAEGVGCRVWLGKEVSRSCCLGRRG